MGDKENVGAAWRLYKSSPGLTTLLAPLFLSKLLLFQDPGTHYCPLAAFLLLKLLKRRPNRRTRKAGKRDERRELLQPLVDHKQDGWECCVVCWPLNYGSKAASKQHLHYIVCCRRCRWCLSRVRPKPGLSIGWKRPNSTSCSLLLLR